MSVRHLSVGRPAVGRPAVRRLLTAASAALLGGIWLAAPAAAHASAQPVAVSAYHLSAGRLGASTGALLGLVGVVVAWRALARPDARPAVARRRPMVALVAGLVGTALGVLVATTAGGGLGTGNGLGGAYVAMLVGPVGAGLGALALARSRRTG